MYFGLDVLKITTLPLVYFLLIWRALVLFQWHCCIWKNFYPSPHVSLVIEVGKWPWRRTLV